MGWSPGAVGRTVGPMETTPTTHPAPAPDKPRYLPVEIAPETWVIQDTAGEDQPGPAVHMNSMVIRGAQPVVVDTGVPDNRDRFFEDVFGLVDPTDVRWIFVSHDDVDHYGNVAALMAECPNATLVASWYLCERLGSELPVPPTRWRWLGDGESLDAGDRILTAIRPPLYDSPTTRGLFDARTGVYWASDCYACPVESGTEFVDDLDPDQWAAGLGLFGKWNSPWVELVDRERFAAECRRIEELPLTAIAGTHGPTIGASDLAQAHALLRDLPNLVVPPQPGQAELDQMLAALSAPAA